MVRSSGAVTDRSWGVTLATLGTQGFTGLLTMTADGKQYSISFDLGRIVGATSPLASDAAVRLALTNHLVSSSQATELNRQIVAAKDRDELEVLAELAGLTSEHIDKLRHRLVAQRAARTFALDNGTYVADEKIAMPPGADLDVREVVYLGARMNLSEQRLAAALRKFGSLFTLKPDAVPSLDKFGFGSEERPVLQSLRAGTSLPQLEAAHRDVDPRMVQAIIYSLVACGACDAERSAADGVVEYEGGPEATPRTATPPQGATYFVARTSTSPSLPRAPSSPGEPLDSVALPPSEIPNGPRPPRASTEAGASTRAPGRPSADDGVARIPPAGSRTQTSDPAPSRTQTGQPPGQPPTSRTQTGQPPGQPATSRTEYGHSPGQPATSRTQTSDPAMSRTETGEPIISLPPSSDPTGFRGEPVLPRTSTPRPGAGNSGVRAPGQPTIPKGTRSARPGASDAAGDPRSPGMGMPRTQTGPVTTRGDADPSPGPAPVTGRTQTSDPAAARTQTSDAGAPRTVSGRPSGARAPTSAPATGRTQTSDPATGRTQTSDPSAARTQTSDPAMARTASGRPAVARTSTARRTQALIAARMILVEQAADYFTLLAVPFDAPTDAIQTAYLNLVRQLHPDKLEELGVPDLSGNAQRVFHQIALAFSVLTDPVRRAAYMEKIGKPQAAVELTARTRTADDIPATPAGDAYRRGESALRRDEPAEAVAEFGRACALDPNNVDFHAMLGWAQFCAARDKVTIAPETRKALERAVQRSAKPTQARFLLGRVERMLGRDREALRHFQEVVETSSQHADAAAEIRAIEARLAKSTGKR